MSESSTTHEIPGWDRPKWAVRSVKAAGELVWTREASQDLVYLDGGVEDTRPPELVRTDKVSSETGAMVHVGGGCSTWLRRRSRARRR